MQKNTFSGASANAIPFHGYNRSAEEAPVCFSELWNFTPDPLTEPARLIVASSERRAVAGANNSASGEARKHGGNVEDG